MITGLLLSFMQGPAITLEGVDPRGQPRALAINSSEDRAFFAQGCRVDVLDLGASGSGYGAVLAAGGAIDCTPMEMMYWDDGTNDALFIAGGSQGFFYSTVCPSLLSGTVASGCRIDDQSTHLVHAEGRKVCIDLALVNNYQLSPTTSGPAMAVLYSSREQSGTNTSTVCVFDVSSVITGGTTPLATITIPSVADGVQGYALATDPNDPKSIYVAMGSGGLLRISSPSSPSFDWAPMTLNHPAPYDVNKVRDITTLVSSTSTLLFAAADFGHVYEIDLSSWPSPSSTLNSFLMTGSGGCTINPHRIAAQEDSGGTVYVGIETDQYSIEANDHAAPYNPNGTWDIDLAFGIPDPLASSYPLGCGPTYTLLKRTGVNAFTQVGTYAESGLAEGIWFGSGFRAYLLRSAGLKVVDPTSPLSLVYDHTINMSKNYIISGTESQLVPGFFIEGADAGIGTPNGDQMTLDASAWPVQFGDVPGSAGLCTQAASLPSCSPNLREFMNEYSGSQLGNGSFVLGGTDEWFVSSRNQLFLDMINGSPCPTIDSTDSQCTMCPDYWYQDPSVQGALLLQKFTTSGTPSSGMSLTAVECVQLPFPSSGSDHLNYHGGWVDPRTTSGLPKYLYASRPNNHYGVVAYDTSSNLDLSGASCLHGSTQYPDSISLRTHPETGIVDPSQIGVPYGSPPQAWPTNYGRTLLTWRHDMFSIADSCGNTHWYLAMASSFVKDHIITGIQPYSWSGNHHLPMATLFDVTSMTGSTSQSMGFDNLDPMRVILGTTTVSSGSPGGNMTGVAVANIGSRRWLICSDFPGRLLCRELRTSGMLSQPSGGPCTTISASPIDDPGNVWRANFYLNFPLNPFDNTFDPCLDVKVSGSYAIAALGRGGFAVVDLTNLGNATPTAPVISAQVDTPGICSSVTIRPASAGFDIVVFDGIGGTRYYNIQ